MINLDFDAYENFLKSNSSSTHTAREMLPFFILLELKKLNENIENLAKSQLKIDEELKNIDDIFSSMESAGILKKTII